MSMFPDCRNDVYYNEDFLNKSEKDELFGFDYATEAADNFFDNLDTDFPIDTVIGDFLNRKIPYDTDEVYIRRTLLEIGTFEEEVPVKTYGDLLRAKLLDWIEMERDEYITSLIDDMDEEDYEKNRKKVLEANKRSETPKEYYDTRKYAVTGKKEFADIATASK